MITERRKYNYIKEENHASTQLIKYQRQIQQLQQINKQIVVDTAKQFEKFEEDVERVETILKNKENFISVLRCQQMKMQKDCQQLKILAKNKDNKIKELETIVETLVKQTEQKDCQIEQISKSISKLVPKSEIGIQTEKLKQTHTHKSTKEDVYKIRCFQITERAKEMEDEIYKLKQQLYSANSELSLLKQEFSSFKVLKEIQNVQKK